MNDNIFFTEALKFLYLDGADNTIKLSADIIPAISLSESGNGTYLFEAGFLSEGWRKGIHNDNPVWIPENEIKASIDNPLNKDFPLKTNHNYDSDNLGVILKVFWDNVDKILKAEGRVNDKNIADLIRQKKIKQVSVTVIGKVIWQNNRPTLTGLRYIELSLVKEGENPGNYIKTK